MGFLTVLIFGVAFGSVLTVPISSSSYRELTPEEANRLANWDDSKETQNMWQLSGQYQGDIILPPPQLSTRNGVLNSRYRWPNNVIPYQLDPVFTQREAFFIDTAVRDFAASTNSCFVVRRKIPSDVDYVYVTGNNTGCHSSAGRIGGAQRLNLQRNGCLHRQLIVHEFLHAVGFYHEQCSTNRDDYITIMTANIITGKVFNFEKFKSNSITSFGQPYDYYSLLHYDAYAFTRNGLPTIVTKDPDMMAVIGRATQMSAIDIAKLKRMYSCP